MCFLARNIFYILTIGCVSGCTVGESKPEQLEGIYGYTPGPRVMSFVSDRLFLYGDGRFVWSHGSDELGSSFNAGGRYTVSDNIVTLITNRQGFSSKKYLVSRNWGNVVLTPVSSDGTVGTARWKKSPIPAQLRGLSFGHSISAVPVSVSDSEWINDFCAGGGIRHEQNLISSGTCKNSYSRVKFADLKEIRNSEGEPVSNLGRTLIAFYRGKIGERSCFEIQRTTREVHETSGVDYILRSSHSDC